MANPLQIRAFQEAEKMIEEALIRDLERIWTVIKDRPPVEASDMLQNGVIPLINKYGLMAAAVAADWYEELTGETAFLPDTYNEESWMASTRWALTPMFSKDAGETEKRAALKRLTASAVRHTRQYYRNTVDESVRRSSGTVRYARRVTGATSCDFCLMLASRGPVYGTAADAGGPSNRYHDDCDCIPVPVRGKWVMDNSERGEHWEGQDPGYDFERLYSEEYKPFHRTGDGIRDTIARKRAMKSNGGNNGGFSDGGGGNPYWMSDPDDGNLPDDYIPPLAGFEMPFTRSTRPRATYGCARHALDAHAFDAEITRDGVHFFPEWFNEIEAVIYVIDRISYLAEPKISGKTGFVFTESVQGITFQVAMRANKGVWEVRSMWPIAGDGVTISRKGKKVPV
ncbi:MAG: hypothetical protein MSC45_00135 [Mobiluncus sp.]|uniref:VG15 protein n=1 Tax=Mobiluncus sp. TaxID=47293 RepID=UPI00258A9059|nr:hypothetical protein [Mobiluncus sp.]MCI6583463.1 hypothetical protein [Mobiluncus sp.]